MNIRPLRDLLATLPDEVTSVQFGAIELEIEELLGQQRQADEAELAATLARAKELQVKLGVPQTAAPRTPAAVTPIARPTGDTDADNGVDYEESEGHSFAAEVASLRQRNVERRRGRGH
jgi:hypothetical protein